MTYKFFIWLIIVLSLVFRLNAQDDTHYFPDDYNQRILILPFDPSVYHNDATELWVNNSNMTHEELRDYLRNTLNRRLQLAMIDSCEAIDLNQSYTTKARNTLLGLYTTVSYEMRRAMQDKHEEKEDEEKFLGKLRKKWRDKQYTDTVVNTRRENGELKGRRYSTDDKYLHIKFNNPDFIPDLAEKRDLDQILFVNQLEIKGMYGDPYFSGNTDAARLVKVHYSLYDEKGNLEHGGFSAVKIPFDLHDPETVVKDYFPTVVRQIVNNIDFRKE
ncbi:MAG: hypothetical protein R6V32_11635 [Bacteroidales bacterium]